MITYVDTSTLIKLIIVEDFSDRADLIWRTADTLTSVDLIVVEARAALATAAARAGRITASQHRRARAALVGMLEDLHMVRIDSELLQHAADLSESEALRAYDAVHLASALYVSASVFSSADRDLCDAAARQGLYIANPLGT